MKILAPIDFSEDATQALRYAASIIKLIQVSQSDEEVSAPELIVLHVFQVPTGDDISFFVSSPMVERAEKNARERLSQAIESVPDVQAVKHRVITKLSLPYEGIRDTINNEQVDLVVMGGRGVNASANWLGSTTRRIIRHASCPVLAVPHTTSVFYPQHVAFATDLVATKPSPSLELFKQLLQFWQAKVHVIHVHPQPSEVSVEKAQEALQLTHFLENISHSYHFVEDKVAARGIKQYLEEYPADLLVVIPRHHAALESLFHKSVSKQLAIKSPVPILSIHE